MYPKIHGPHGAVGATNISGVSDPVRLGGHCAALGWLLILSGRATLHGCWRGHCGSCLVAFLQRTGWATLNLEFEKHEQGDQTTQIEISRDLYFGGTIEKAGYRISAELLLRYEIGDGLSPWVTPSAELGPWELHRMAQHGWLHRGGIFLAVLCPFLCAFLGPKLSLERIHGLKDTTFSSIFV